MGEIGEIMLNVRKISPYSPGKLYIFGKKEISSFQKYIVVHGHYGDIYLALIIISPIFPITLVPFWAWPESYGKVLT